MNNNIMNQYVLNIDKYRAAMLYLLSKLGKVEGKKKFYKLFYYIDFDYYESHEKPVTGDVYVKWKMGPVPKYFDAVVDSMKSEVEVSKEKRYPMQENDTVIYSLKHSLKDSEFDVLNESEKKMIDRVIRLYGSKTGTELELLSHKEAPFNAVEFNEIIPYEYSFYRDTSGLNS
jgi:uncharacterized phage-associated protein